MTRALAVSVRSPMVDTVTVGSAWDATATLSWST